MQVTAVDSDSGTNGELTYSLVYEENKPKTFTIQELKTGTTTSAQILSNVVFNRTNPIQGYFKVSGELVYPVTVKVEDAGRPKLSATCFFLVSVLIVSVSTCVTEMS